MDTILFVDATVRDNSRTRELAEDLLSKLNGDVSHLVLCDEDIAPLDRKRLEEREKACKERVFSDSYFKYAKQFADADSIVIAAPYWDCSFPAVLKKYMETISVCGLTFEYTEDGACIGLCKAKQLYYVTTAGGVIIDDTFGYGYISGLALYQFGIKEARMFKVENLDIEGTDTKALMARAKEDIDREFSLVKNFGEN